LAENTWKGETSDVAAIKCPSCKALLEPDETIGTETIVCTHCHSLIGIAKDHAQLLGRQSIDPADTSLGSPLKIGTTGFLRGKHLRVTGIIKRTDGTYVWHEISLADDANAVTWIWVERGHFSLCVCEGKSCVSVDGARDYKYQSQTLRLYDRAKANVVAVAGQIPFTIDPDRNSEFADYIAPPYFASHEDGVWWVFEYVPAPEVETAFGISCSKPDGIGINQPSRYQQGRLAVGMATIISILVLMVIHAALGSRSNEPALIDGTVDLHDPTNTPPESFGPFTLDMPGSALEIEVSSPLDNAWTDLTLALVDQATTKTYWTSQGVEFYSGIDSDGAWTQGSRYQTALIRSIPPGQYMLLAHGETGTWNNGQPPQSATVRIYARPAPISNFLLALGLIIATSAIYVGLMYRYEAKRWSDSAYSPYVKHDS
jgi:hypothetical protein